MPARKPRLMDQMRTVLRTRHYSRRTEKTYCYWVRYFIRFHGLRHPLETGGVPFATELLKRGADICTVQELLGQGFAGVRSPLA